MPGGIRRDPLGSTAGRAGHVERGRARVRARAGARGGCDLRRRGFHGDSPESGAGAFRRTERMAAAPDEIAARNAEGDRYAREATRLCGANALKRSARQGTPTKRGGNVTTRVNRG